MDPFTPDGRPSASALRAMARQAQGALGELPGAGLDFYASGTSVLQTAVTPDLPAWVKVTSATLQTVTFPDGSTVQAYPGLLTAFQAFTPAGWADTTTAVWFYPANGEVPTLNNRYPCLLLGADSSGEQVWGSIPPGGLPPSGSVVLQTSYSTLLTASLTNIPGAALILSPGDYLIWAQVSGALQASTANAQVLLAILYDTTAGSQLSGGPAAVAAGIVANVNIPGTGFFVAPYTNSDSVAHTVQLQAYLSATANVVSTIIYGGFGYGGGSPNTQLAWLKAA